MGGMGLTVAPGFLGAIGRLTVGFGMPGKRMRANGSEHKRRLVGDAAKLRQKVVDQQAEMAC
jgi:hypothetical protein